MKQYLDLMRHVRDHGVDKSDRTGTGTRSVFGHQMRFDLNAGFPLVTTKKCHLRSIIHELLWFLQGDTNIKYLQDNGVRIWDEWADEDGDLGPVYGYQWRNWPAPNGESIDQISKLIEMIKTNPDSRRLLVTAWNPAQVDAMALPPCHALFQFYVADGKFIWSGGDCHLYSNHMEQVEEQLSREPLPLPSMRINSKVNSIFDFTFEDFELCDYQAHPHIKAQVAV